MSPPERVSRHTTKHVDRCCECGATEGLTDRQYYVGGRGYLWVRECEDLSACAWRRAQKAVA